MLHLHYQALVAWLELHPHFSGIIAFLFAFMESIAVVGSIVPGSVTMTAVGIAIGIGAAPIWSTIVCTMLGAVVGDGLSYFLGLYYNGAIQNIWPFSKWKKLFEAGQRFMQKHGGKSVFIGRFVAPVRAIVPVIAGMCEMPVKRYFLASIPAGILWAPIYMLPGIFLGAVSMEMPKDVAAGLLLSILVALILIWFITKTINWFFIKTQKLFGKWLDHAWLAWTKIPGTNWIRQLLRLGKTQPKKGQLLLATSALVSGLLLLLLFINVITQGPLTHFNQPVYHLFRSIRTPTLDVIMVFITTLGYFKVTLLLAICCMAIFFLRRNYLEGFYFAFGIGLADVLLLFFKKIIFSPRPTGILHVSTSSSFPSGHTTLAVAVYGMIAFFISQSLPKENRKIIFQFAILTGFMVAISRLYLNAHWLTDVIAAACLGYTSIAIAIIGYRRFTPNRYHCVQIAFPTLIAFVLIFGYFFKHDLHKNLEKYQLHWTTKLISIENFWQHNSAQLPVYRLNRAGRPVEVLNIQWAGKLHDIEKTLAAHHWKNIQEDDYVMILTRIFSNKNHNHHTLLPVLYNDHKPAVEMIKFTHDHQSPLILRLWPADILLAPNHTPLWAGTVYYVKDVRAPLLRHKIQQLSSDAIKPFVTHQLIYNSWQYKIIQLSMQHRIHKKHTTNNIILIRKKQNHFIFQPSQEKPLHD